MLISHLQFADDTLFFLEQGESSFRNLLTVVGLFCSVSGLKINMAKSTLLGMGVDEDSVTSLVELVGCEIGEWPITYLGMPLAGNPCSQSFWEPVISKVTKRLDGWMEKSFFVERREIDAYRISFIGDSPLLPFCVSSANRGY